MKKLNLLLCASLFVVMSGCSDASANISDGSTVLFTVNGEKTTKEDIYTLAKSSSTGTAGSAVMTLVRERIFEVEVPKTEDMEKEAKKTMETAKENFGDTFETMLKNNGYQSEDDYYEKVALGNIQAKELTKKYLNDEEKISEYQPIKAQVIVTTSKEKAESALSAVKDDSTFEEAASEYGDTSKSDGSEKIYSSASGISSTVWQSILNIKANAIGSDILEDTTNSLYYVVKVIDTDVENFKDEALETLSALSSVSNTALIFYLEKHDFNVWDIDVYNQIKTSSPTFLVQDN